MIKKIFSWGNPAQEGFFAVTLCFFWALVAPMAALLFVPDLYEAINSLAAIFALLIPGAVFALYLIGLYCFYSPSGMRNVPLRLLYSLAVPVVMFFLVWVLEDLFPRGACNDRLMVAVLTVMIVWMGPLAFAPRSWKWGLLAAAAWSVALWCVAAVLNSSVLDFYITNFFGWHGEVGLCGQGWLSRTGPLLFDVVLVAGILLLFAAWLCTGRMYAAVSGIRFKELFTPRVYLVVGMAAAVWGLSFVMALGAVYGAARTRAALALHFGRPLAAEELGKMYFKERRPDAAYWRKFLDFGRQMNEYLQPSLGPDRDVPNYDGELPPTDLAVLRRRIASCSALAELERLCDAEIPACGRVYRAGDVAGVWLDDLAALWGFCRFEAWRLRFAVEAGDREGAMAALRRLDRVIAYMEKDDGRIPVLLCRVAENIRLYAWERLTASGMLTAGERREIARTAATAEKRLPEQSFRALYWEAVYVADSLAEFHRHLRLYIPPREENPPLDFTLASWLFPPWRYRLALHENALLKSFLVRDWRDFKWSGTAWHELIYRFYPGDFSSGEQKLCDRYRALRTKLATP